MYSLHLFGENVEFDHVGLAVRSMPADLEKQKIFDPLQHVNVAFININGLRVELVEPVGERSPVVNLLKKNQSLYHLCFRTRNIPESLEKAKENGFHCIAKPVEAVAFGNKNIVWLYSRQYGLVELVENL